MAVWSIHLLDLHKACTGSSADNEDERNALKQFSARIDAWARVNARDSTDQVGALYMKKAWQSNCQGLRTGMQQPARSDRLFEVRQSTTNVTYLLGKISAGKWGMTISEVISSTRAALDLELFEHAVDVEALTNPFQTRESIGVMRQRIASTSTDIVSSKPLQCLFAWTASNAKKVMLTANTVGLIDLYERFGFEVTDARPSIADARRLVRDRRAAFNPAEEKKGEAPDLAAHKKKTEELYNDAKFAQVNAEMTLSDRGRGDLQSRCRFFVDYVGPVLG